MCNPCIANQVVKSNTVQKTGYYCLEQDVSNFVHSNLGFLKQMGSYERAR